MNTHTDEKETRGFEKCELLDKKRLLLIPHHNAFLVLVVAFTPY
jgi:hypothetical protein